jgi:hypothetical protein
MLCARLKAADRAWLPRLVAGTWSEAVGHGHFATALGRSVVLIPVPGSAPAPHADWVAARLAWCLWQVGLAAQIWPVLRRLHAVRKSAFAAPGERPSVLEHYASFTVERTRCRREAALQLTLVDDVITRGRTVMAAARKLHEAFPAAQIRAFALLRTLRPDEVLRRVLDPCEGEVQWICGDARRCP